MPTLTHDPITPGQPPVQRWRPSPAVEVVHSDGFLQDGHFLEPTSTIWLSGIHKITVSGGDQTRVHAHSPIHDAAGKITGWEHHAVHALHAFDHVMAVTWFAAALQPVELEEVA